MITLINKDKSENHLVNHMIESFENPLQAFTYFRDTISQLQEQCKIQTKKEDFVKIKSLIGLLNNCILILLERQERLQAEHIKEQKGLISGQKDKKHQERSKEDRKRPYVTAKIR